MNNVDSRESCKRLARAICSDVMLYNEKLVQQAKQGGLIPPELARAIAEGRELYLSRTTPEFVNLYDAAFAEMVGIDPGTAPPPKAAGPYPIQYGTPPKAAGLDPIQTDRRPVFEKSSGLSTFIFLVLVGILVGIAVYFFIVR